MIRSSTVLSLLVLPLLLGGCAVDPARAPGAPSDSQALDRLREAHRQAGAAQELALRGQSDEAIDLYLKAVQTYPDFPAAWNNLGSLLMNKNRNLEAAEAFKNAADQDPTDSRPLANLGSLWERQRYYPDARRYYDQALERKPNDLQALRGAVRVAHLMDQRDEQTAALIRRGLLLESDADWRSFFERQKALNEGRTKP